MTASEILACPECGSQRFKDIWMVDGTVTFTCVRKGCGTVFNVDPSTDIDADGSIMCYDLSEDSEVSL